MVVLLDVIFLFLYASADYNYANTLISVVKQTLFTASVVSRSIGSCLVKNCLVHVVPFILFECLYSVFVYL